MNKMLDEIAAEVIDEIMTDDCDWFVPDEFIQKFGEMVIARCANLANSELARLDIYGKIKDHFGVEK